MIIVDRDDPRDPQAPALLRQSHALMQSLYSADDCHFLPIDALCAPDVAFFTARRGEIKVGCGALARREGYGEVKSMFVNPAARGQGIADAILRALEDEARGLGLPCLRLETGHVLRPAHRLYQRHGFAFCGPFGTYSATPVSLFMEKTLCA